MTPRRLPSRTRRRALAAAAALATTFGVALPLDLGWLRAPRRWEDATGYARIPPGERPTAGPAWQARGSRDAPPDVWWLGHSGFVLRWHGVQVLLDPNTSPWCTVSRRALEPAVDVASLGPVDAVVLSHAHYDHLDMPTLLRLPHVEEIVLPRGAERYFDREAWSATRFEPLDAGECATAGPLRICGVPAEHDGNRLHPFASRIRALGWILSDGSNAVYFAGDTGFDNPFAAIRGRWHPRLAILPIGAFRPRFPMRFYHLSPDEAVEAAVALGAETVIPCHFGTFTLSLDPPSQALPLFAHEARARGVRWLMPRLLTAPPSGEAP